MKRLITSDSNITDNNYATLELTISIAPGANMSDIVKLVKNKLSGDLISVEDINVVDSHELEVFGSQLEGCDKATILSVIRQLKEDDEYKHPGSKRYKSLKVIELNTDKVGEEHRHDNWQVFKGSDLIANISESDSKYSIQDKLQKGTIRYV